MAMPTAWTTKLCRAIDGGAKLWIPGNTEDGDAIQCSACKLGKFFGREHKLDGKLGGTRAFCYKVGKPDHHFHFADCPVTCDGQCRRLEILEHEASVPQKAIGRKLLLHKDFFLRTKVYKAKALIDQS